MISYANMNFGCSLTPPPNIWLMMGTVGRLENCKAWHKNAWRRSPGKDGGEVMGWAVRNIAWPQLLWLVWLSRIV